MRRRCRTVLQSRAEALLPNSQHDSSPHWLWFNYVEHPEVVADRVRLAVQAAGGDPTRVMVGTDCGFDTSAGSNRVDKGVVLMRSRMITAKPRDLPCDSPPLPSMISLTCHYSYTPSQTTRFLALLLTGGRPQYPLPNTPLAKLEILGRNGTGTNNIRPIVT